ncbi:MAG: 2Fe-2S iron-sulfur cluster-binding protein [Candidatus Krumholzibacteriota bacterium]
MPSKKVRIRFEGTTLECRADTTVAAALWENGVRHLSHSPKYGRPRGLTCARGHCTACLMRVDRIPNVRTCELPVREGMEVARQDAGAFYAAPMQKILAAGSRFFPVGFYYKWFTRPPFLSRTFLDGIRPMTGVGRLPGKDTAVLALPSESHPSEADEATPSDLGRFDTVVVGAGPAGLRAAATAEGKVLVLDDHDLPGGQRQGALRLLADRPDGNLARFPVLKSSLERIDKAREELAARDDLTFLARTRAIAGYNPDSLVLRRDDQLMSVRFDHLVWAAGALDTLGLFAGNDTPGVLGPRALYRLLVRDGLQIAGRQALVIGDGPDFWLVAALLDAAGARLSLVLAGTGGSDEISAAVDLKWPLNTGLELEEIAARGDGGLKASFVPGSAENRTAGARLAMEADLAVICGRGKPAYDIPYQLGADLALQPGLGGFTLRSAGEPDSGAVTTVLSHGSRLTVVGEACGQLPGRHHRSAGEVTLP